MNRLKQVKNLPFDGENKNKQQSNSLNSVSKDLLKHLIYNGMYKSNQHKLPIFRDPL